MCCFAGAAPAGWFRRKPLKVAGTEIFARRDGADQLLAYSMRLSSRTDVAMILPLPVAQSAGTVADDALHFIDLHEYPELFTDLDYCWNPPLTAALGPSRGGFAPQRRQLVVHNVGSFEASFVPTLGDFDRLDPRFRLSDAVWAQLPQYRDHSFAVFKLKAAELQKPHPMAFRFPTRDPERLFFPTVHVHDGRVHKKARFDHTLYYQGRGGGVGQPSLMPVTTFVKLDRTHGLVIDAPVHRTTLTGKLPNQDTWI